MIEDLQIDSGQTVRIEHNLGPDSRHAVIFSHGFGVKRDSRGLFTDLTENLPAHLNFILFDYYQYLEDGNILVSPISQQVRILKAVYAWAKVKNLQLSLIGHSMGCLIPALANLDFQNIILLAPPTHSLPKADPSKVLDYFMHHEGASKVSGAVHIPKKSGAALVLPADFSTDQTMINPLGLILNYASIASTELNIISAQKDEAIQDPTPSQFKLGANISIQTIQNADHNFTGSARLKLITAVLKIFNLKLA
jgi:hypothetical protein